MAISPAATRSTTDVITEVLRTYGDEAQVVISSDDILRWINAGQVDIVRKNNFLQAVSVATTVIGQNNYSLPADIIAIEAVQYSSGTMLQNSSLEGVQNIVGTNVTSSGDPKYYWTYGNSLFLYPVPISVDTLSIYYRCMPPNVVGGLLSVPDVYFNALVNYCLAKAFQVSEDFQVANSKMAEYNAELSDMMNLDEQDPGAYPVVQEYGYW